MLICGIDEAGKGPCIGPLVLAGVVVDDAHEENLKNIGVKDSKLLTPERRQELFPKIKKIAKSFEIVIISPEEIDMRGLANLNLNQLEAFKTALIINKLKPDKAILDCPSNNIKDYIFQVRKYLDKDIEQVQIIAEHKADVKYAIVGAASILAKVTRDNEIERIKKEVEIDFGSGYPSDPNTINFLAKHGHELEKFPKIFRHTWDTLKQIKAKKEQKTLASFGGTQKASAQEGSKTAGTEKRIEKTIGEQETAVFSSISLKDIRSLEKHDFTEVETKSEHESLRMQGAGITEGVVLILYKTGKLVLQGPKVHLNEARKIVESVLKEK